VKYRLYALGAVILWSFLAVIGAQLTSLPPFLMLGLVFAISGIPALFLHHGWKIPFTTLLVGIGGIFGYHFLYIRAIAYAPAVEANLINYLWPLLIVLLSPLIIPGFRLKPRHILAGLLGLLGAYLLISQDKPGIQTNFSVGYLLAAGAALTWSVYSLLTSRVAAFPTASIAVFCLISSVLAFTVHFMAGGNLMELSALRRMDWLLITLMGLGPMGAAFYLWDAALKIGDPRAIGSLAYLTPLLSTFNLVIIG
jgi:drug/metabolite transporter (DMT)-like permease